MEVLEVRLQGLGVSHFKADVRKLLSCLRGPAHMQVDLGRLDTKCSEGTARFEDWVRRFSRVV